jgi:hypothetical protein
MRLRRSCQRYICLCFDAHIICSHTHFTCVTDLLRIQLLLRRRHGLSETQHASLLLGLLQPRSPTSDAQDTLGHDCFRRRLLPDHSLRRHLLLRHACLCAMVAGGGRMFGLLRARTFHPELYAQLGLLSGRLLNPINPLDSRSTEVVGECYTCFFVGSSYHCFGYCALCLFEGWYGPGESCV